MSGLYKRVGNVVIVGRQGMSKKQVSDKLARLSIRQGPASVIIGAASKLEGIPKGSTQDRLVNILKGKDFIIGGTVAKGKKGTRAYVNRPFANSKGINLREIVHHESFHNIPIIGKSEIAAHFAGGLKSKKGKLSPFVGIQRIGHLAQTRPGRAGAEAGIGGIGIYGANRLVNKTERKKEPSATSELFSAKLRLRELAEKFQLPSC